MKKRIYFSFILETIISSLVSPIEIELSSPQAVLSQQRLVQSVLRSQDGLFKKIEIFFKSDCCGNKYLTGRPFLPPGFRLQF